MDTSINAIKSLVLSACLLCLWPSVSFSASELSDRVVAEATTKELLLLFWEEKDLYVQSPSRYPKLLSQTAENVTVITAKDIEAMNAHSVAEVLNRVPGVVVTFQGQDFVGTALISLQGSDDKHVKVLLDGVPWNLSGNGHAELLTIPVQIIARIEIVKGSASSVWGSALGGVINIITKSVGNTDQPSGAVSLSYGTANSQDGRAEILGRAGGIGYYVQAGRQESKGLRSGRDGRNYNVFGKVSAPIFSDASLGVSIGYSAVRARSSLPTFDLDDRIGFRSLSAAGTLDVKVSPSVSINVTGYSVRQLFSSDTASLGFGMTGNAQGDLFENLAEDDTSYGINGRLTWKYRNHTGVVGVDVSHAKMEQTILLGQLLQMYGAPEVSKSNPGISRQAIYVNDTIEFGPLSITPGVRYDNNSQSGSFISPSLGVAYRIKDKTVLRASVGRGFTEPGLVFSSSGGLFLDPNPSLKPEKVISYQASIESNLSDYLWVKVAAFQHDIRDTLTGVSGGGGPPVYNDIFINGGKQKLRGVEAEAETVAVYNVSLKAGVAYTNVAPSEAQHQNVYSVNAGVKYDDRQMFNAQLFGHYIWWNVGNPTGPHYNAVVWDLVMQRKLALAGKLNSTVFLSAHNIFNGSQYINGDNKNPQRWVEIGMKFDF